MAFRFRLQSILRLRESLEHQEKQRLLAAAALVARLRETIQALEDSRMAEKRQALEQMAVETSGASLQFEALRDALCARARERLLTQLDQAESNRKRCLQSYQTARQKREILESLRDRQQDAYRLESTRREQQETDESFLLRLPQDSEE